MLADLYEQLHIEKCGMLIDLLWLSQIAVFSTGGSNVGAGMDVEAWLRER